jgi:hypothetical protein
MVYGKDKKVKYSNEQNVHKTWQKDQIRSSAPFSCPLKDLICVSFFYLRLLFKYQGHLFFLRKYLPSIDFTSLRPRVHPKPSSMAHLHPIQRQTSPLKQLANFINSSAGLDLTLRLIQALAQIMAEVCIDNTTVMGWLIVKSQLAFGMLLVDPCTYLNQAMGHFIRTC